MAGGDSYGAAASASSSSGANQSGALEVKGGGVYGSTTYGPGSLLTTNTDQSHSLGASTGGMGFLLPIALAVGAVLIFRRTT